MSVWRNVQVERPSSSTSGGQEEEGFGGLVVVGEVVEEAFVVDFIMLFHAAPEVQVRHLFLFHQLFSFVYLHSFKYDVNKYMICLFGEWIFFFFLTYGFPSGPITTPLGTVCGLSASSARMRCSGLASSGCGGSPVMVSIVQRKYCRMGKSMCVFGIS